MKRIKNKNCFYGTTTPIECPFESKIYFSFAKITKSNIE